MSTQALASTEAGGSPLPEELESLGSDVDDADEEADLEVADADVDAFADAGGAYLLFEQPATNNPATNPVTTTARIHRYIATSTNAVTACDFDGR
jgi:hypothetical protein